MEKIFFCLFICLFAGTASASIITLDAIDKGTYNQVGQHDPTDLITRIGTEGDRDRDNDNIIESFNSFYNFDVSPLAGTTIASVELIFTAGASTFWTRDLLETVEIWDVTTTPGAGNTNPGIYADLMSGVLYGQVDVDTSSGWKGNMPDVSLFLSPDSFADILNDGFFSLGAHVSTLNPTRVQYLWEQSDAAPVQLRIDYAVPEPTTMILFGTGLVSIVGFRLRRKNKQ